MIEPETSTGSSLLNPFIFPAETRGRFMMLIVAALILAWRMGNLFVIFTMGPPGTDLIIKVREYTDTILAGRDSFELTAAELVGLSEQMRPFYLEMLATSWPRLVPPLLFMLIVVIGATLIYRNHPHRILRQYTPPPQLLTKEKAPTG